MIVDQKKKSKKESIILEKVALTTKILGVDIS
jgi:hypothetical protein